MNSQAETPQPAKWLVLALLLTSSGFLLILIAVSAGWCHAVDSAISSGLQNLRTQPVDALMLSFSLLGDGLVATVVTVACVGWLLWQRCWRLAASFALAMLLVYWGVPAVKMLMTVPRPNAFYTGRQAFSFPSGHSTSTAALWGIVAWLVCSQWHGGKRVLVIAAAALLIGSVAISRVVLAAHWPSDVLAGVLLGLSLAMLFALSVRDIKLSAARPLRLGLVALITWLGFGCWHAVTSYSEAQVFYRMAAG